MVKVKRPLLIPTLTVLFLLNAASYMPSGFAAGAQTLYGCDSGGAHSSFYSLDASTGAATLIGASGGMGMASCSGLRFQPGTGVLFAVGTNPSAGNHEALFTVNTATGIATPIADTTVTGTCSAFLAITDISFRSDGALFGLFSNPTGLNCLGTINPTTAAVTSIGNTGDTGAAGNGLAFDASDVLWHGGALGGISFVDTLNQATGAAGPHTTLTSSITCPVGQVVPRPNAFAFNSAGTLYGIVNCGTNGSGPTYLATINTSTGAVTNVGSTLISTIMDGIAWTSIAPPIPEYPFGLPILAIFMIISYGLIRRRTSTLH